VSPQRNLGISVFDAAIDRLVRLYEEGHRLVVSFSGGKDSTVCLQMALIAAEMTGRLPVELVMRDEEIMVPGTYEYCERVAARDDVVFHWLIANNPVINVFNRDCPYFWAFDPLLDPSDWVRTPPGWDEHGAYGERYWDHNGCLVEFREDINIDSMTTPQHFPPPPGKNLYAVIGLRVQESLGRRMGLMSSKSYITKPNRFNVRNVRPVFDWGDGDVWLAIDRYRWDHNEAYNVLYRLGAERRLLRIAPPSMNVGGVPNLKRMMQAWPQWFDRVDRRLPGIRTVAMFGKRAVMPQRHFDETWEQCYQRLCIDTAPPWIAKRAERLRQQFISNHAHHSVHPLNQVSRCLACGKGIGSWKLLCEAIYNGDPFSTKADSLPFVEPSEFRDGAGTWAKGAKVSF
jgi:predicted phosphoadenosine phosphosulfate sulfurtransferase